MSVMKDYGCSRLDRFNEEKTKLKKLPEHGFERAEWKEVKVHPDCHIQVERNFYSVPYCFVGSQLRVKIKSKVIEIFDEDLNQIAVHSRIDGQHKYSTLDSHYPEKKIGVARFELKHAKQEAERIGPITKALVNELIDTTNYPLQYLRRIQGIIRLSKTLPKESIEFACGQAHQFRKYRLKFIKDCAKNHIINGSKPKAVELAPVRESYYLHLHSADK